ncbi:hypothetical protein L7F22_003407 [Adiantum nelumboides]|nr:hypothetical protein [Adiantum nelumboides]
MQPSFCWKVVTWSDALKITNKVNPISSYAILVIILLAAPACEYVSYKALIIAGSFSQLLGYLVMRFGTTILSLQIMQIIQALSDASYFVYQAFLFFLVAENHFQTMTSFNQASTSMALFVSSELVNTIPQPAPSTHVVTLQDTKQTLEESVGVLTRSQRAALGLNLSKCTPSTSEVQTAPIHKKGKENQQDPLISNIDGAFLEAIADLQQVTLPTLESAPKGKLSAEFFLKNTFQQVSLSDMLRLDAEFRGDTLFIIQYLYPGASTSGGHLPLQPAETYMISYPTAPLIDYRSPRLTVTILGKQLSGVIVDGGFEINLMLEFTMLALGLQPTRPAPFTITLADQRTVYPLGMVEKVALQVQDFPFELDLVVVCLPQVEGGFPLLIGRA